MKIRINGDKDQVDLEKYGKVCLERKLHISRWLLPRTGRRKRLPPSAMAAICHHLRVYARAAERRVLNSLHHTLSGASESQVYNATATRHSTCHFDTLAHINHSSRTWASRVESNCRRLLIATFVSLIAPQKIWFAHLNVLPNTKLKKNNDILLEINIQMGVGREKL